MENRDSYKKIVGSRIDDWKKIEKDYLYERELKEDDELAYVDINEFYSSQTDRCKRKDINQVKHYDALRFKCERKHRKLKRMLTEYNFQKSCFLLDILLRKGAYRFQVRMYANDLKLILGKNYKELIKQMVEAKWIEEHAMPHYFDSEENRKDTRYLKVIGKVGSCKRYPITDEKVLETITKYKKRHFKGLDALHAQVKYIVDYNTHNARFKGSYINLLQLNQQIKQGHKTCKIGGLCNRVYGFATEVKRSERKLIRLLHDLDAAITEIDISACFPLIIIALFNDPTIVRYALTDSNLVEKIVQRIGNIDVEPELIFRMTEGYYKDFYNSFWRTMLENIIPGWQEVVEKSMSKEDKVKFKEAAKKERFLLKKSVVYVINSNPQRVAWVGHLTKAMKKNYLYSALGHLLDQLKDINFNFEQILGDKKHYDLGRLKGKDSYAPYKNLGILLFRLEAFAMQLVMASLWEEGIWFLPIHDSMLCRKKDSPIVAALIQLSFIKVIGMNPNLK